jgi:hypothetical protein
VVRCVGINILKTLAASFFSLSISVLRFAHFVFVVADVM